MEDESPPSMVHTLKTKAPDFLLHVIPEKQCASNFTSV
jgi:hypothetical protein